MIWKKSSAWRFRVWISVPGQQFGNACAQYGRIYGPGANNRYDATIGTTLNQVVGSEDCLYLNIWRPVSDDGSLPVIVFEKPGNALRHFADEDRATWALGVGSDPRRHRGAARPRRGDQCRQLRQGTGARDHHA